MKLTESRLRSIIRSVIAEEHGHDGDLRASLAHSEMEMDRDPQARRNQDLASDLSGILDLLPAGFEADYQAACEDRNMSRLFSMQKEARDLLDDSDYVRLLRHLDSIERRCGL